VTMQRLTRLMTDRRGRARALAAWLALVPFLGALPGAPPARAACAPRVVKAERACPGCHRAEPAPAPRPCSTRPCCGCEISEPLATAPAVVVQLERPASHPHGLPAELRAMEPFAAPELDAPAPGALDTGPPDSPTLPTILRL